MDLLTETGNLGCKPVDNTLTHNIEDKAYFINKNQINKKMDKSFNFDISIKNLFVVDM